MIDNRNPQEIGEALMKARSKHLQHTARSMRASLSNGRLEAELVYRKSAAEMPLSKIYDELFGK